MRYYNPHKKNSTLTTILVCAVCFWAFSLLWLYYFQADVLAVGQHVLSGGVTHYNRSVGALLITVVLYLLEVAVFAVSRLSRRTHALTYLPSMLALAFLSDINPDVGSHFSFGVWRWAAPVVLAVWAGAAWLSRQLLPFDNDDKRPTGLFSRRIWLNLLQMAAMMLGVAAIGNTNATFHYRAHMETALMRGDLDDALRVGKESDERDPQLTMLRVHALARKGRLGDELFTYKLAGTSADFLPGRGSLFILPADTIWKHLGGRPIYKLVPERYYQALQTDSLATRAVADYVLCGLLVDRKLDDFVKTLPSHYEPDSVQPLPHHYREALVLYDHLHKQQGTHLADAAMEEKWNALRQLEAQYPDITERRLRVFEDFEYTYWWYYLYGKQQ